ncbi:MAG TPA: invasion associated locus B family protein [Rhizomicrobium sp.]|jgi:invasion protein IalB|nr:invasion associated locus B family protein [Rhizomicrobium sp.]
MPFDLNNNTTRAVLAAVILVVGFFAGFFIHKAVAAMPDSVTETQYDDWRVTCPKLSDKDTSCEMQLDVPDEKRTTELARLQLFKSKETGATPTLLITVPYNTLLDAGIGLQFNKDKATVYQFEICNDFGCVVRIKFDDALAASMGSAQSARILVAGLDGKPAALPFSLKGYAAAHKAFVSDDGKRHSWWKRLWS